MLTITARTEPAITTVNLTVSVNDPPYAAQTRENEENEKSHESFAEILAGALNSTDQSEELTEIAEEMSIKHFDGLTGEELLNDLELSDIVFLEENQITQDLNSLLSEKTKFEEIMSDSSLEDAQTEFAVLGDEFQDFLSGIPSEELTAKNDAFAAVKEKPQTEQSEQSVTRNASDPVASAQGNDEALAAENAEKKNRGLQEKNSAQTLSKAGEAAADNASVSYAAKKGGENSFSHNKQEEKSGKLDDTRSRPRRDKISFEVRDQRTNAESPQARSFVSAETAAVRAADTSVKDITLELRLPDFNNANQNAQTTWEVKAASAVENMLARELHNNFNGDIVRHASMALRDNGESTIRLALKPDTLGNVKIQLEMADNKITGVILVESEEALNAFKKEIASLEQAFKDSGFADVNLDLSLAGDGNNSWERQEENTMSMQMAAYSYEEMLLESEFDNAALIDVLGQRTGAINMLA